MDWFHFKRPVVGELTWSLELRWLQGEWFNGPDPALLRLCGFTGMARLAPVTASLRSDGDPLQASAGPLEARAVPRRSTRGVPGPLVLPGPALERGRPVRLLSVGHVARTQRTDLVFNPGPGDAAPGQRSGFGGLLWGLLRVHGGLGLEVGAVLRVEHGVAQPRNKPLEGEAAMRWGDPPQAAQHSAGQVLGVCALPATLNLRDVDVASSTIIQNVKEGPQAVQEGFGQPICWILRLLRLHLSRFKALRPALEYVFSRPNSAVYHRRSVQFAASLGRYQSHWGIDYIRRPIN